jgi:hypothetical protein
VSKAAEQKQEKTPTTYVRAMFGGSSDPSATDPVYFAVNGKKFLVPREKEFIIEADYLAHLMESETRHKSVYKPATGSYHVIKQKVSFNRPQILERLTAEQAAPLLAKQAEEEKLARERQQDKEDQLAQEAE